MPESNPMWLKPSKSPHSLNEKIKLFMWLGVEKTLFQLTPHKLSKFRILLLRIFGAKIGNECFIHQSVSISKPWNFEMGYRSSIDFDVIIRTSGKVVIGDFVSIAYKVNINTGSHDYSDQYFFTYNKAN